MWWSFFQVLYGLLRLLSVQGHLYSIFAQSSVPYSQTCFVFSAPNWPESNRGRSRGILGNRTILSQSACRSNIASTFSSTLFQIHYFNCLYIISSFSTWFHLLVDYLLFEFLNADSNFINRFNEFLIDTASIFNLIFLFWTLVILLWICVLSTWISIVLVVCQLESQSSYSTVNLNLNLLIRLSNINHLTRLSTWISIFLFVGRASPSNPQKYVRW